LLGLYQFQKQEEVEEYENIQGKVVLSPYHPKYDA